MERNFIEIENTASTNDDLKKEIRKSEDKIFAVVSAKKQSGGRGRLGKSFFSPEGGAYFSISFPLVGDESSISFLTLLTGLCVSEALEEMCNVKTQIKWPNDIYLNGKKLCGILCELVSEKNPTVIAGIGINLSLKKDDIPPELENRLTSVFAETGESPDRGTLIKNIVTRLDSAVYKDKLLCRADEKTLLRLKERSFSIGKRATVETVGFEADGWVTDIAHDGAVIIKLDNGDEMRKI